MSIGYRDHLESQPDCAESPCDRARDDCEADIRQLVDPTRGTGSASDESRNDKPDGDRHGDADVLPANGERAEIY